MKNTLVLHCKGHKSLFEGVTFCSEVIYVATLNDEPRLSPTKPPVQQLRDIRCHCSETIIRTMRSFTLVTALLLCSWISVSVSESQTVEVQPGEEVTLLCSNISRSPTHTFWSRLYNKTKISCISSVYGFHGKTSFCDGFKNGKYEMRTNVSTIFLIIKEVDLSDSGLYLCGFYMDGHTILSAIDVNVKGNDESHDGIDGEDTVFDRPTNLTSGIFGGLTVFLVMVIIGVVVKALNLQTVTDEKQNPQRNNDLVSGDLKDVYSPAMRSRRPPSQREVETHVIYAASR
ncbi:uncharacterized protein [Trachinotus anak]|uniref:uncharacterized protein isoform X2 n=1 Tax=Trachinotus anak TaxID=443729 RepID=UPI0039F2297A